jgi:hypothetical protein
VTPAGRPGELGIGDRVRFGGRDQTVIGVSGPVVRLADTGGQVVAVSVSGLLSCVPQVRVGFVTRSGTSLQVKVAGAGDGEPDAIVTRFAC